MKQLATSLALLSALLSAPGCPVAAHDGPHLARVITDVIGVQAEGRDVLIDIRIEALQDPVELAGASASGATSLAVPPDVSIVPGDPLRHRVHLRFDDVAPPLFSLSLDFGEAGLGTVLIVLE